MGDIWVVVRREKACFYALKQLIISLVNMRVILTGGGNLLYFQGGGGGAKKITWVYKYIQTVTLACEFIHLLEYLA